jgi:cell division protein FtsL
MSTIAQNARIGTRHRSAPGRRARAKPRIVSGGVVWIALFAALLSGVVAINVAVLRLNLERDRVSQDRAQLQADIARLRSELSTAAASAGIEAKAQRELGLAPADPSTTVYVQLRR